jgi:GrpB-like predicted nucleotidyltransferase (UPF0157 family)
VTAAPVAIVAYDPSWPEQFARERALLTEVLAPCHRGDCEAYTDAKTDFVAAVLARAGQGVGHGEARRGS